MSMGGMEAVSRAIPFRDGDTEAGCHFQVFSSLLVHTTSLLNSALADVLELNPAMVAFVPTSARVSAGSQSPDSAGSVASDSSRVQLVKRRQRDKI